jgi:hypothetical protein
MPVDNPALAPTQQEGVCVLAKVKLFGGLRHDLYVLVDKTIECPAEKKVFERDYAKVAPKVREILLKTYPIAEMEILKKWEAADLKREDIHFRLSSGGDLKFDFEPKDFDTAPFIPYRRRYAFYLADPKLTDLLENWRISKKVYADALVAKKNDYITLIKNSGTFEDIVAVWPEAEVLRPKHANAITTISAEVIARIAGDAKNRKPVPDNLVTA